MTNKIKSIQAVTAMGAGNRYEVGGLWHGYDNRIGEIKDVSLEYPDHIYFMYQIFDVNGNLMFELINCPVEIQYAVED